MARKGVYAGPPNPTQDAQLAFHKAQKLATAHYHNVSKGFLTQGSSYAKHALDWHAWGCGGVWYGVLHSASYLLHKE